MFARFALPSNRRGPGQDQVARHAAESCTSAAGRSAIIDLMADTGAVVLSVDQSTWPRPRPRLITSVPRPWARARPPLWRSPWRGAPIGSRSPIREPAPRVPTAIIPAWAASSAGDRPDRIPVAADKPSYRVGETAHVRIKPTADGKALVVVASDKVFASPHSGQTSGSHPRLLSHLHRSRAMGPHTPGPSGLEQPAPGGHPVPIDVVVAAAGDQDLAVVQERRAETADLREPGRDHLERTAIRVERLDRINDLTATVGAAEEEHSAIRDADGGRSGEWLAHRAHRRERLHRWIEDLRHRRGRAILAAVIRAPFRE